MSKGKGGGVRISTAWSAAKGRAIAASYALGWWLVCRVPESWGRWVFQQAGDIAWRRQGRGVQVLEANLRRVIGPEPTGKELRALSRTAMSSYARYWFEVFRLPVISTERIVGDMHCVAGKDTALALLAAGRGVVMALPHMGNWDHAGAWIIGEGVHRFTTVAERLEPESLARRFFAFRESLGFEVLPATGSVSRFGILAQRLRDGGLVCLPSDRDITGSGIEVDFFGEKARMMGGPAALAIQTGAALMPVTLWFEGAGWGAHIHEEILVPAEGSRRDKVLAMTQEVARVFEEGIRIHPEDWHMLQRVFVADLDLARLAAAEAKARSRAAGEDGPAEGNGSGELAGGRAALDGQAEGGGS
jgi:KDO2-lipid IV(A) lauroyltransferase